jgi:hypothetical protein
LSNEPNQQVRLSAEEREHAKAGGVSEFEYAKQKLKRDQMRKAGLLKD